MPKDNFCETRDIFHHGKLANAAANYYTTGYPIAIDINILYQEKDYGE